MANSSLNVTSLDFDEIKTSLKDFMRAQPRFSDVDFEGSNINVLLDVLSYNTYLNSFYLNMVASEMFIDTAQLRSSMISHAKALNYLPRSRRSALAFVNISITPSTPTTTVTIPSGTEFTTRVGDDSFTFSTDQDIVLLSNTTTFTASNVAIFEGTYSEDAFIMDTSNTVQRFVLSDQNIDTTSLGVIVSENSGINVYSYEVKSSLYDVSANTAMCFLQAAEDDKYEIVFGNGIAGRPPTDGGVILTRYRVSSGSTPNGASVFTPIGPIDSHANVTVTTVTSAADGAEHEDIESIRFNAPRYYQTQERAVTANDYKVMLQATYPEITAVNVFGGEDADPPRYGTVVIALAVAGTTSIPEYKKTEYSAFLKRRTSLSSDPLFIEPTYLEVDIDVDVRYNTGSTTRSALDIETAVRTAIATFNTTKLNDFTKTLYYSSLVKAIDAADSSIISNDLYAKPFVKFVPTLNVAQTYELKFYNSFRRLPHSDRVHIYEDEHTIRSTPFTFEGVLCTIEDDGLGSLRLVQVSGTNHLTVRSNIGTVDYDAGVVTIVDLNVSSYVGNGIKVYAIPLVRDIAATRNQILRINNVDVGVNIIAERLL